VHSGSIAISITSVWPKAATTVWGTNISLHTLQCAPSVNPASSHVGATVSSITSVCPKARTTTVSRLNSILQTLQ
jgi:hypothetical protein